MDLGEFNSLFFQVKRFSHFSSSGHNFIANPRFIGGESQIYFESDKKLTGIGMGMKIAYHRSSAENVAIPLPMKHIRTMQ